MYVIREKISPAEVTNVLQEQKKALLLVAANSIFHQPDLRREADQGTPYCLA